MDEKLIKQIKDNKLRLVELFSNKITTKDYVRYFNDGVKDKYGENFTDLFSPLTSSLLNEIYQYKKDRQERHIRIATYNKEDILTKLSFNDDLILTMAANKVNPQPLKINNLKFLNLKNHPEIINDILYLELKHYGKVYGESFEARDTYHYFVNTLQYDGLDYFVCYFNNNIVGHAHTYYSDGVVALDGLLVDKDYRHLGIGSNLISYVQNYYNCPIYLHASEDETSKDMYTKLGFETIDQKHYYLYLDKSIKNN